MSSSPKTSFRKRQPASSNSSTPTSTRGTNVISGTRPYVSSVPGYMTSIGIPALDSIIGPGGIPLGTCTIIKEDVLTGYARLLLDYVVAQAFACGHHICHVTATTDDDEGGLNHIMGVAENRTIHNSTSASVNNSVEMEEDADEQVTNEDEKMKIAWRYESMPKLSDSNSTSPSAVPQDNNTVSGQQVPYHRVFDLTKTYSQQSIQEMTQAGRITIINARDLVLKKGFDGLLIEISSVVEKFKSASPRNVLRLVIRSLGSPMWHSGDGSYSTALYRFIVTLKALIRPLDAICIISIPAYMYNDSITSPNWLIRRLEWAADAVLEVESFAGTQRTLPPILTSTYHGLIHPHKRFWQYTPDPETKLSTFAFKCRRRKFDIQVFYLPPEQGGTDRPESVSAGASGGGTKKKGVKFAKDDVDDKEGGKNVRFVGKIDF